MLVQLELENFKSYKGRQTVGPFDRFTSIIGPNGSGKSNIMDAISFVLGVQSIHLRSSNLRELVHNSDTQLEASVSLHYQDTDRSVVFCRKILRSGTSEYCVDAKHVDFSTYAQTLETCRIMAKTRHFLIFQGDVESIASRSPRELTKMLEQISGSLEFEEEYNRLKHELDNATRENEQVMGRKRGLAGELKTVREQQEKLTRYEELVVLKEDLFRDMLLLKLGRLDHEIGELEHAKRDSEESIEKLQKEMHGIQNQLAELRKSNGTCVIETMQTEKKYSQSHMVLQQELNVLKELQEKAKMSVGKERQLILEREQLQHQFDAKQRENMLLSREQERLARANQELENKQANLPDDLVEEYQKVQKLVQTETAELKRELERIQRVLYPLETALEQLNEKQSHLERHQVQQMALKSDLEVRVENLEIEILRYRNELSELQRSGKEAAKKQKALEHKENEIAKKLENGLYRMLRSQIAHSENNREQQRRQVLSQLKKLFPGVYGLVMDLYRPVHGKYARALGVAFGKNLGSIVVDREKTALDCIRYLRDQRAAPMTFIPLDRIRIKTVPELVSRTAEEERAKLTIDLVVVDQKECLPAYQYVSGDSIVCDTMQTAKNIVYTKRIRVRTITLDGTVIHKNRLITGGFAGNHRELWGLQSMGRLQKENEEHAQHLARIRVQKKELSEQRFMEQEQEIQARIVEIESDRQRIKDTLSVLHGDIDETRQQLEHADQEIRRVKQQHAELDHRKKFEQLAEDIKRKRCKEFFRQQQIPDWETSVCQYDRAVLETTSKLEQQKEVRSLMSRIEAKIEYNNQTMNEIAERIESTKVETNDHGEAIQESMIRTSLRQEEHELTQVRLQECRQRLADNANTLDEYRNSLDQLRARVDESRMHLSDQRMIIEKLWIDKNDIFRFCKLENIGIEIAKKSDPETWFQQLKMVDSKTQEDQVQSRIDSASLDAEKARPRTARAKDETDIETRFKETVSVFEASRQKVKTLKERFDKVREQRKGRFLQAFDFVSTRVDRIYRLLTDESESAGTTCMCLDSEAEPYLEGIRYNVMPPAKRFCDMEQLSGGERSLAALALIFALALFQQSPFIVLDEVDAALDNVNLSKLVQCLTSTEMEPVQFVVISLKSLMYEKSRSLLGVYRDQSSSRILSLKLDQYPDN